MSSPLPDHQTVTNFCAEMEYLSKSIISCASFAFQLILKCKTKILSLWPCNLIRHIDSRGWLVLVIIGLFLWRLSIPNEDYEDSSDDSETDDSDWEQDRDYSVYDHFPIYAFENND